MLWLLKLIQGTSYNIPSCNCELALLDNLGSLVCQPKLKVVVFELGDMTVWLQDNGNKRRPVEA
jgi:hypothetical protein